MDRVVVSSPSFDYDLGFLQGVEDHVIRQLIAQLAIEGFTVTVLSRAFTLDTGHLGADGSNPFPECCRLELRTIVRPNVGRNTSQGE